MVLAIEGAAAPTADAAKIIWRGVRHCAEDGRVTYDFKQGDLNFRVVVESALVWHLVDKSPPNDDRSVAQKHADIIEFVHRVAPLLPDG